MAKISGILTDGTGQIINNCTIELYAKKTTSRVLTQTQAFKVAENGEYSMNILSCEYDVSLIINGFPKKRLGTIQVFSDSADGTLNDYLLNPSENEVTPAILQQVFDARNEAKQAATKAETSEKNSKTSETNATQSAKNAKTSETNSANSASSASQSATDADSSARSALSSATSAQNSADNANNSATSASQSATNAGDSAKLAKESENNSKTSETNAAQSAKDAQKWASTVDNSNFIQKSGEENQSIDGSLDAKKLTENGVRVYSPNNKPTADDIGALAATKTVVNNVPTYKVGNLIDFSISPKINGIKPIYIVESYRNGYSWYNVYSNGFIEQSGVISVNTDAVQTIKITTINLLKPMKTQNYGVGIDLYSKGGPWGWVRFACGNTELSSFVLNSYTESKPGTTLIRWTVRGY